MLLKGRTSWGVVGILFQLVELEEKYKKVQTVSSFLKIFSRCIRLM